MTLLHPIKYKWNTIGEQLEVCYGVIKSAEYNVAYDNTTRLSEVLQVWKDKKTCEVSWKMIITVVDEPPLEDKKVADEMCEFLARLDIRSEYLSSNQPGKIKTIIIEKKSYDCFEISNFTIILLAAMSIKNYTHIMVKISAEK